jgi:hypothetical protein
MRRMRFGAIGLGVGVALAIALVALPVARPLRLVVFAPFWVGAIGVFQARQKTCVVLVARGQRNLDGGDEPVVDPSELDQLRKQASAVYLRSLVVASALSIVTVVIP